MSQDCKWCKDQAALSEQKGEKPVAIIFTPTEIRYLLNMIGIARDRHQKVSKHRKNDSYLQHVLHVGRRIHEIVSQAHNEAGL